MRKSGDPDGDFSMPLSPEAALAKVEVGMVVELQEIRTGRAIYASDDSLKDDRRSASTYLIEVNVREELAGRVPGRFVLEAIVKRDTTVESLRAAMPKGTLAVVLASRYTEPKRPTVAVPTEPGLTYLAPAPFGLLLKGSNGNIVSPLMEEKRLRDTAWQSESFDTLVQSFRTTTPKTTPSGTVR